MRDEMNGVGRGGLRGSFDGPARPVVSVDIEKYQALLDAPGLTDEQKEEFLQSLWSVIVSFVELGFGVHPMQEVCGQDPADGAGRPKDAFDQVGSREPESDKPPTDAGPDGSLEAK
ncbi:hypothetical protein [Cribrihabitans pelagius]|uniref:hypothetical protein n=1 Tax=Cribrihabitans pelagius TaxID=1765746 RepID=UPI003B59D702